MKVRSLVVVGVSLLITSLVLSFIIAIPEVSSSKDCREYFLRASSKLFIYWGNYTFPGVLSNISLSIVSPRETLLNITYGVVSEEPINTVALSTFTYFIGNKTYFYVYVIPHEDTELVVCLNALIIQQKSYLLLPTLISWVSGITIITYVTLTHVEKLFRKSLKKKK